jgi:hypothetical protein
MAKADFILTWGVDWRKSLVVGADRVAGLPKVEVTFSEPPVFVSPAGSERER